MALVDTTWYCNSVAYAAVTARPQNTAVAAGVIRKQFTAPAVNSERCFICIIAGTTANVTDATWVLTRGAKTTDGTATWMECTGQAALNGDLTNTSTWAQAKAATPAVLGQIIKRSNGASYQICTTAGAMSASEPAFSNTAGTTTTDTTAVWTSLGPVGNFTGGQAPHARLANACASTWFAANNTVYVGANHAESQATAISITAAGTSSSLGKILCHNQAGSYPPAAGDLTTGAAITTTGTATITFNPTGAAYVYGLTFKGGVGGTTSSGAYVLLSSAGAGNQTWLYFENCSFQTLNTVNNSWIQVGTTSGSIPQTITFNNCTVYFGNVNDFVAPGFCQFFWQNTGQILAAGSLVPTQLFSQPFSAGNTNAVTLEALDLSQCSGSLFSNAVAAAMGSMLIKDCKLHASVTVTTPTVTGMIIQLVRCDSTATGYKSNRYLYEGTEITETSVTRVGGATDPTGQSQSRKITTTVNAQWLRPFRAEPYAVWNDRMATDVVVTVYGTINAGAVPNNDDIWMEVEYLADSASPLGDIVTTTKASVLASNAAVASDSSSWNGGGSGAGWSPFKLTTTLSSPQPQLVGYLHARVRAAKPSTTYYIDPQVVLS